MGFISPAYSFLIGLYIGGYTNIFSRLLITSLVVYIVNPEFYSKERIDMVKSYVALKFNNFTGIDKHFADKIPPFLSPPRPKT